MFQHPKPACSWEEYVERARRAERRGRAGAKPGTDNRDNFTHKPLTWPAPEEKRCTFEGKVLGRRCKAYAVKGASRCWMHGGLREVPDHPANGRAYRKGLIDQHTQHLSARDKLYSEVSPQERESAREACRANGIPAIPLNLMAAVEALRADDGGRAWRRFVASQKGRSQAGEGISRREGN